MRARLTGHLGDLGHPLGCVRVVPLGRMGVVWHSGVGVLWHPLPLGRLGVVWRSWVSSSTVFFLFCPPSCPWSLPSRRFSMPSVRPSLFLLNHFVILGNKIKNVWKTPKILRHSQSQNDGMVPSLVRMTEISLPPPGENLFLKFFSNLDMIRKQKLYRSCTHAAARNQTDWE